MRSLLSGGILTVTGTVEVSAGSTSSLQGGTLADATLTGGSTLALTGSGGTLAGVTVAAGATVVGTQPTNFSDAVLDVTGGLTLNGTLNAGSASGSINTQVYFQGSQTLSGIGTVVLGGSTSNALYAQGTGFQDATNPATLTISSGITVQGGSGVVSGYYPANDSVILDGTVAASSSGKIMTVGGGGSGAWAG